MKIYNATWCIEMDLSKVLSFIFCFFPLAIICSYSNLIFYQIERSQYVSKWFDHATWIWKTVFLCGHKGIKTIYLGTKRVKGS